VITSLHGRQARAFERAAGRTTGEIVERIPSESGGQDHVLVRFSVEGERFEGRAALFDAGKYDDGQKVEVLYDRADPTRIVLDEERYNLETPFLFWSAMVVGGALPGLMGWWWTRRVRRLATAPGPTFAMLASVVDDRRRPWTPRRRWVTLYSLDDTADGAAPVGTYPVMPDSSIPLASRRPAQVKGNVRDGGLVVARVDDRIAWPVGRLHD
jgi:hypothetical protein